MDQPFDTSNIGRLERPSSSDHNRLQSQMYRAIRTLAGLTLAPRTSNSVATQGPSDGFIAGGFKVAPSSPTGMTVVVNAGMGFQYNAVDCPSDIGATDLEMVDDLSPHKPLVLTTSQTFAVPAAPGPGTTRIDIIEVRANRLLTDSLTRRRLDVATRTWEDHNFYKTLQWALDGITGVVATPAASTAAIGYKTGTAAGSPVAPATTAGYIKIAEIIVPNGTATITGDNIADYRPILTPDGAVPVAVSYRLQWNAGAPIVTVRDVVAPPGMIVSVDTKRHNAGFIKGRAYVNVFGGKIRSFVGSASCNDSNGRGRRTQVVAQYTGGIGAWDAAGQAGKAFHTPAPDIGVGQSVGGLDVFVQVDKLIIPASAAACDFAASPNNGGAVLVGTSTAAIAYPIVVPTPSTIQSWDLYIKDVASGTPLTARLFKTLYSTGVDTALGSLKTSSQVGGEILADHNINIPTVQNESYWLKVVGGGGAGAQTYELEVDIGDSIEDLEFQVVMMVGF